ncbi:UBX domain-containing protein 4-like isoform X2 [Cylas formicarius]|uniref:UBX domain-containing protein 4-like isoform X2 n=1 Tax=Cylas formicarius TaxID=197179 RepID=UPI00295838A7|nr:UBX domain-containing protein 4-like isoform X2 [Cylas formicarius]
MKWYNGGIAEAITSSKTKGAIFVVYIEGNDEKSQKITQIINDVNVSAKLSSDNFVAIKLEANSVAHQQFSEIYKQASVPAIYLIGKDGIPLEIITEAASAEEISNHLDSILEGSTIAGSSSKTLIDREQKEKPVSVCENKVCTIKQNSVTGSSVSPEAGDVISKEEKIERAKKLLEQKRQEKQKQEKENEKLKELERRKVGQEAQKFKMRREDQELKQLMEEREKDRKLEKEARERVLAQIAQDKAERAARFSPAASSTPKTDELARPTPGTSRSHQESNAARLLFKLPDGSIKTQEFSSFDKLQSVVNFIKANLNLPFTNFTLSTTFPRRQFSANDYAETLLDLQLTPNAVILILPVNSGGTVSTSSASGSVSGFIWSLFVPLFQLFNILKAFISGGNSNHDGNGGASSSRIASKRPENPVRQRERSTTVIKKEGNIRRLGDIKNDDDDDTNTWNGNSTQQL